MGNLLSDIRYCLRGFARRPLFAVVVVTTLALGLSINAAIFSIYDQMLLRELPVPDAGRARESRRARAQAGQHVVQRRRHLRRGFQLPDVPRSRAHRRAVRRDRRASLRRRQSRDRRARRWPARGLLVSGSYFPLLGLQAGARPFARSERRSRRRRGERRRAELRLLGIGVRRRSRRRRPRRSSSTASR